MCRNPRIVKVEASISQTPLRSMSAARNVRPSGVSRTSCGIEFTPDCTLCAAPPWAAAPVPPGVLTGFRSITLLTLEPSAGITSSLPLNSQLTTKADRSAV